MSPVIQVRDLKKHYRYAKRGRGLVDALRGAIVADFVLINALSGVSFDIAAGERVAIIGPNGAGKSTLLKILSGILEPSAGDACVLDLTPWRQRRALAYVIGVVFGQRSQLWAELAAGDAFALLRRIYDQEPAVFQRRLTDLSERFGLGAFIDQPVQRLSLGQRMRCEIVASLLHKPQLLFLDEPTIGLDVTAKAAIRDFIREQAQSEGQTVLLTSHDTRDIELVCERVIVINDGGIVVDSPTNDLRRRFLGRKLVTLRSLAPAIEIDIRGVTRRSSAPHTSVFDVDTTIARVDGVIQAALAAGGIEDVTIEDPPLDEVVHEIYAAVAPAS